MLSGGIAAPEEGGKENVIWLGPLTGEESCCCCSVWHLKIAVGASWSCDETVANTDLELIDFTLSGTNTGDRCKHGCRAALQEQLEQQRRDGEHTFYFKMGFPGCAAKTWFGIPPQDVFRPVFNYSGAVLCLMGNVTRKF